MKHPPRIVIALVVLTTLGAAGYGVRAARGDDDAIRASGIVEATEADLGFQITGRLERVTVREGDLVAPGAELGSLERFELLARRVAAEAQVRTAEAQLAELTAGSRREEVDRARATWRVAAEREAAAKRDVERSQPLAARELLSRESFDQKETALRLAEGERAKAEEELHLVERGPRVERIAAQRATLEQARAALGEIDVVLGQSIVRAPFAGMVTVRHREPGEAVSPGLPVVTLRDLGDRWVRIYVPGDEVGRLSVGAPGRITADAYADRAYDGTVSYIASVAEFTPRNVQTTKDRVKLVYEVRVRITGDTAVDLKPGLPADVSFASPRIGVGAPSDDR